MTLYKKIASNTIFQLITKALTAGISIILLSILTKNLSIEHFGIYNKVFQYLGIFAFLADLGLYTIAIREISKETNKKESIIGNILTLRIILGLCVWILALILACFLPGFETSLVLISVAIIGFFTFISLINSSLLALMQSQMKIEFSLISTVTGKILNLVAVALLCLYTLELGSDRVLVGIFSIATIAIALTTYMNYIYARRICAIRPLFEKEYIYKIFKLSLPYGMALFLSVVYFKIDVIMIGVIEGNMANTSIALYSLPMKIVEVLMVVGGFYLNSLLPSLTETIRAKKKQKLENMLSISFQVLTSFGICIVIFSYLFGKDMISILATTEYLNALPYNSYQAFKIVSAVLLFHFLALISIYILIAEERQGQLLWINLCIAGINIGLNIYLIPKYSFYGAAIATLISQIILFLSTYIVAGRKYISVTLAMKKIFPSICNGAMIGIIGSYILAISSFNSYINIFFIASSLGVLYVLVEYICITRGLKGGGHKL